VPLLIIDDLGLKPLRPPADEDLHELIAERHETTSTIVTSNLGLPEWDQAFRAHRPLASATLACVTTPTTSCSTALRTARRNSFLPLTSHGLPTRRNPRILDPATMSVRPAKHWRLYAGKTRLLDSER
jgi:hypothetical protein